MRKSPISATKCFICILDSFCTLRSNDTAYWKSRQGAVFFVCCFLLELSICRLLSVEISATKAWVLAWQYDNLFFYLNTRFLWLYIGIFGIWSGHLFLPNMTISMNPRRQCTSDISQSKNYVIHTLNSIKTFLILKLFTMI